MEVQKSFLQNMFTKVKFVSISLCFISYLLLDPIFSRSSSQYITVGHKYVTEKKKHIRKSSETLF